MKPEEPLPSSCDIPIAPSRSNALSNGAFKAPLPVEHPRFFSAEQPIHKGHNRLPHWDQQGCTYAITFRLADSIPESQRRQLAEEEIRWRAHHPEPWDAATELAYHRQFTAQLDLWMDEGHGSCILRQPPCATTMAEALRFHEGNKTKLEAFVIMPNHVHVLTGILAGHALPEIMASWKGYSSRTLNQRLGRQGTLWQKSYHDRLIRDWDHFGNVVRYIRRNPLKAKLQPEEFIAWESPLAKRF